MNTSKIILFTVNNMQSITVDPVEVSVRELNECLGCKLCGGYFRDAHTISECLHTFCKVCLFKEFDRTPKLQYNCPTCHVALGPLPWQKVIFDRTLQGIVDKIFPQFAEQDRILGRLLNKININTSSYLN